MTQRRFKFAARAATREIRALFEPCEPRRLLSTVLQDDFVFVQIRGDRRAFVQSLRESPAASAVVDPDSTRILVRSAGRTLLAVPLRDAAAPHAAVAAIGTVPNVKWTSLNYSYAAEGGLEYEPNDPLAPSQYALNLVQAKAAWDVSEGNGVIVAVTDEGFALTHPDLAPNVWTNPGEIAGNGIDDEGDGYIDNVNGWDFTGGGDNNPASFGGQHGLHVAGIVSARTNNATGIAGLAGRTTLMPLRIYDGSVSSLAYFDAFRFAVDHGAKIISTSLGFDPFVNDAVFLAALQYVYDNGAIHVNSAGNDTLNNPVRVALDTTLLTAATGSNDARYAFSNYGTGIDIAAPGVNIQSTVVLNNAPTYAAMNGTSMAAPAVAATAALIWAAHPTYTRDQVVAALLATADNIDAQNPGFAGLLGAGRINALAAVTAGSIAPPRLHSISGLPQANGSAVQTNALTTFSLRLDDVFDRSSAENAANYTLVRAGADNIVGTADDVAVGMTRQTSTVRYGRNVVAFRTDAALAPGRYRLTVRSGPTGLQDPFGQSLDGNRDGIAGDDLTRDFIITPNTPSGDFNLDGHVNFADLLTLAKHYGTSAGALFTNGDADQDGDVDFADLLTLAKQYGT